MSRNSRKLKPQTNPEYKQPEKETKAPPNQPPQADSNPFGISFVVPTETVSLPSAGKYYPVDSPLHGIDEVEIKHMTAKEEDILSSLQTASDEKTFDKLINSLIVGDNIPASEFLEEDKMAILLRARATGYGNEYSTTALCTACGERTEQIFDLSKVTIVPPSDKKTYNPENNTFSYLLPMTNIEVELHNFTVDFDEELEEEKAKKEKYNIPFNYTVAFLEKVIISANSITDAKILKQLVDVMPAADAKNILNFYTDCRPALSTLQEVTCGGCGHVAEREVPLSWAFFRTDA